MDLISWVLSKRNGGGGSGFSPSPAQRAAMDSGITAETAAGFGQRMEDLEAGGKILWDIDRIAMKEGWGRYQEHEFVLDRGQPYTQATQEIYDILQNYINGNGVTELRVILFPREGWGQSVTLLTRLSLLRMDLLYFFRFYDETGAPIEEFGNIPGLEPVCMISAGWRAEGGNRPPQPNLFFAAGGLPHTYGGNPVVWEVKRIVLAAHEENND